MVAFFCQGGLDLSSFAQFVNISLFPLDFLRIFNYLRILVNI